MSAIRKAISVLTVSFSVVLLHAGCTLAEMSDGTTNIGGARTPIALWKPDNPSRGNHGLIIISHGTGGSLYDHRGTARLLTQRGYFVASVIHAGDNYREDETLGTPAYFPSRVNDLRSALDRLLVAPETGQFIDKTRIAAIGYSAGGASVLGAAGADFNLERLNLHCQKPEKDPRHCAYASSGKAITDEMRRTMDWGYEANKPDKRLKALVLVNPVGTPFGRKELSEVTVPVLLITGNKDQILNSRYHAYNIQKSLPDAPRFMVVNGAHHFFFIQPMPWGLKMMGIEAAQDPVGYDRLSDLNKANEAIVSFLNRKLE